MPVRKMTIEEMNSGYYRSHIFIDEETGVEYMIIQERGNLSNFGIVPRYNADGTLKVWSLDND